MGPLTAAIVDASVIQLAVVVGAAITGLGWLYRWRGGERGETLARTDKIVDERYSQFLQDADKRLEAQARDVEQSREAADHARADAAAARAAAEAAKRELSDSLTAAAHERHDLVAEKLELQAQLKVMEIDRRVAIAERDEKIGRLERAVAALQAQMGQLERREA